MRALIIGIDGYIGANLARSLVDVGCDVVGTTRRDASAGPGRRVRFDLVNDEVASVPVDGVDVAFFCAAMARFADCRERPEISRRVNVVAPAALGARLVDAGARVVLLSTSAVFDGRLPFSSADRPTCPLSSYGAQKAEAEAAVSALGVSASIFRLTKVLSPEMPLLRGWMDTLRRGGTVAAFEDVTIAPLAIEHVISGLSLAASSQEGGVFQISGARDVSYADVAGLIAEKLGADPGLVRATRAVDAGIPVSDILPHTTLDVSRLAALGGWRAPDPRDVLSRVYDL